MDAKNIAVILFVGFIIGLVCSAILANLPNSPLSQARDAVTKCEEHLPRSQECIITAILKEKGRD